MLDVLRWARIEVDLGGAADETEALTRIQTNLETALHDAGDRPLAARIVLTGITPAHAALSGEGLRDKILNEAQSLSGQHRLWLEAIKLRTRPPRDPAHRQDTVGKLLAQIDAIAAGPPPGILGDWPATLSGKLAGALPDDHPLRIAAGGGMKDIMEQAKHRLEAILDGEA